MTASRRSVIALGGAAIGLGVTTASAAPAQAAAAVRPSGGEYPTKITYASIQSSVGRLGLGVRTPGGVVDVAALEAAQSRGLPVTVEDVINKRGDLAALATLAANAPAQFVRAENGLKFGPVVSTAPKIFCVGLNYRAHIAEEGQQPQKEPMLFNKFDSCLNNHGGTIAISAQRGRHWDYEAELVMIIGRGGKNIPKEQALSHVFGYCNGNDFTERERQRITTQYMLGKSGDGWGPLGPWLVSADQIDPQNLSLKCIVNGQVRQDANTSDMIFDCKTLVSYISENWELKPGDVIFTGTPEGVINGMPADKQVWLKPGDKVSTAIDKLGALEFTLT